MKTSKIPKEWKSSISVPIHKKGEKRDPNNYRNITLLCSILKLFTKIIVNRIRYKVTTSEEQQGFRANRSTVDAIFIVRQLIEKAIEFNKPMFICFVDFTKAFDRIKLDDVLKSLEKNKIDYKLRRIVKELYTGNKTRIKTKKGLSEEVRMNIGIRQGDSLSPTLFNIVMDQVIKEVYRVNARYRIGSRSLKVLFYADDGVIIAENEDDLQRLVYKMKTVAEKFNMEILINKTQSMVISKDPIRWKLTINNGIIQQVLRFNYLGVSVSSERNLIEEARTQAMKASRVSGYLRDIIWKNKMMSPQSKIKIYKTCVRPILTYPTETRAETSTAKRIMRTTEMRILRIIKEVTLRDRIRSEDIREELGVQDVVR